MQTVTIRDEYIKLQQALQLAGVCSSGVEAKYAILDGKVSVNGETELRRGKKMRDGDTFCIGGKDFIITSGENR